LQILSGIKQYVQRISTLSRNTKLYLVATILQGLSFGIWGVIFNLYLNLPEVGFQLDFIGNMFSAGAIATGLEKRGRVYEIVNGILNHKQYGKADLSGMKKAE